MEDKVSIHLVDDQGEQLVNVFENLLGERFSFSLEKDMDTKKVVSHLRSRPDIHVVLLDIYQDGQPKGINVLQGIRAAFNEEVQVIMISEKTDVENVVATVRGGALDYVGRSIYENLDNDDIRSKFANKLLGAWEKAKGNRAYRMSEETGLISYGDMIGDSPVMQEVHRIIDICAPKDDVVILLTGETGTGKERAAWRIHDLSTRKKNAFIPCNLGGIPRTGNFLQAHLFGVSKNAGLKGEPERPGIFEQAHGGTVFLDEIGTADPDTQQALLRTIQEKEVVPLGEVKPRKVDFGLVCGTNEDLMKAMDERRFREDLYYRINDIELKLPPLRERGNDIVLLTVYFLKQYNSKYNRSLSIRNEDVETLISHSWPGNVRELEHLIKRSVILTPETDSYLKLHFDLRVKRERG
jgi:two-component system, NtrC family, response regulator AtoC